MNVEPIYTYESINSKYYFFLCICRLVRQKQSKRKSFFVFIVIGITFLKQELSHNTLNLFCRNYDPWLISPPL